MAIVQDASGNSPIGNGTDQELESISQTGSGSPYSSVTPLHAGAQYLDTANQSVYIAHGTANTDWVLHYPSTGS